MNKTLWIKNLQIVHSRLDVNEHSIWSLEMHLKVDPVLANASVDLIIYPKTWMYILISQHTPFTLIHCAIKFFLHIILLRCIITCLRVCGTIFFHHFFRYLFTYFFPWSDWTCTSYLSICLSILVSITFIIF